MKQKDYFTIFGVALITALLTYFIASQFITTPKNRSTKVEQIEVIKAELSATDPRYFNSDSVDSTQKIEIGNDANNKPFDN